jgi:hypothetical protein
MRKSTSGLVAVRTLHQGDNYGTNAWTVTAIRQRNVRPHMPVIAGSKAIRKLSPLHASSDQEALSINGLN